jgi:regulator of replication initiation timing
MPKALLALSAALALAATSFGQPASAPDSSDLAKQLADTQGKLQMALHSYGLLEDENARLKDENAALKAQLEAAHQSIDTLKPQASAAGQLEALRNVLRQSRDEVAALAQENANLRARLALVGPPPGTAPSRPAQAPAPSAPPRQQ